MTALASQKSGRLLLGILGVAAILRFWGLDWLPAPAGDEGNWLDLASKLARGEHAELGRTAGFVSLLFARLLSVALRLGGPSFAAARAVNSVGVLVAIAATYACLAAVGARRAGLLVAAALAVHPWTVFWSRTVSVPYALALWSTLVGPALLFVALHRRRPFSLAAAVILLSMGAHFSPLTALTALACMFVLVAPRNRWALRQPALWLSVAVAAVNVLPIVLAAARVARVLPPRSHFDHFADRLRAYAHMIGSGLFGESTLRHATERAMSVGAASWLIVAATVVVGFSLIPSVRRHGPFRGFGALYLLVVVLLMPFELAAARSWHLARIDTERYMFVVLPGFLMCLSDLAEAPWQPARAISALTLVVFGVNTARMGRSFLTGGGADTGVVVAEGGANYRGWRVAREHRATALLARDAMLASGPPPGGTVVLADWTLHPLRFALEGYPLTDMDVHYGDLPTHPGRPYFFVLWADEIFQGAARPPGVREDNERLRRTMTTGFVGLRRLRRVVQPNGYPLLDVYRAEERREPTVP